MSSDWILDGIKILSNMSWDLDWILDDTLKSLLISLDRMIQCSSDVEECSYSGDVR